MGGACNVGVGKDREELRRCTTQDAWSVDIAHGARQRGGHRLQHLVGGSHLRTLDEKHAEVALIAVRARELIFQHRSHEPFVEEACGPVDDVQRLSLRIVSSHSARRTEDRAAGKR